MVIADVRGQLRRVRNISVVMLAISMLGVLIDNTWVTGFACAGNALVWLLLCLHFVGEIHETRLVDDDDLHQRDGRP
jgi:hypothetical protein